MKYQFWPLLLLVFASFDVMADEGAINTIRSQYKEIRDSLPSLRKVEVELNGYSADGGGAIGYIDNTNQIKMIRVELYGESGKAYEEYYYHNGGLFFAFYENHEYNVPYYVTPEIAKDAGGVYYDPSKTVIAEDRYYFNNGKLIRWLDNNKEQQNSSSEEYNESEKSVKEFSEIVYKLITNDLTISSTRTYLRCTNFVQNRTKYAPLRYAC